MILAATLRDASWITANLRPLDRQETYCQLPEGVGNVQLAAFLVERGALIAYDREEPVLLFGTAPMTTCALSVWALGTERTPRVIPEVSRHFIADHIPQRLDQGFLTMEARSIATHGEAHRWMEGMGGERHGDAYLYGKGGEFFVTYRWTVSSYRAISRSRWADAVPLGVQN